MSVIATDKLLVVNADDFGLSDGVNRGIIESHERGIVTSASLMVRQPAARAAAEYARGHELLGVGLHLDLGEWAYVDGSWKAVYEVVPTDRVDLVTRELERQLDAFTELMSRPPTHLDSHQHVHRSEPVRTAAKAMAERLRIPLRDVTPGVRHRGDFYGQDGRGTPAGQCISTTALVAILQSLPAGVSELGCHPGIDPDLASCYRSEREVEMRTLCDPEVRKAVDLASIRLCNFAQIPREEML